MWAEIDSATDDDWTSIGYVAPFPFQIHYSADELAKKHNVKIPNSFDYWRGKDSFRIEAEKPAPRKLGALNSYPRVPSVETL